MNIRQRLDLYRRLQKMRVIKTPLQTGTIPTNVRAWVKPKIVVEVKYYERTRHGMFRMPDYVRERIDKAPKEVKFLP